MNTNNSVLHDGEQLVPKLFGQIDVGAWFKENSRGAWYLKTSRDKGAYTSNGINGEPTFRSDEPVLAPV